MKELTEKIIAYESGAMDDGEAILFFQELVDSGVAWQLQGHYGRVAATLIDTGMIKPKDEDNGTEALDPPRDV